MDPNAKSLKMKLPSPPAANRYLRRYTFWPPSLKLKLPSPPAQREKEKFQNVCVLGGRVNGTRLVLGGGPSGAEPAPSPSTSVSGLRVVFAAVGGIAAVGGMVAAMGDDSG
eukprot:12315768-Heterocapsa_arctica.AAC.1